MLGFIFGTVCLVALIKVMRHGRGHHGWRYAHGGCGGHGWHGHHDHGGGGRGFGGPPWARWGGGGGGFGEGFMMRGLFQRLETTPGQEKVIKDAFQKVRETLKEARAEWQDKSELVSLLRGDTFDRTAAEGLSGKADASFAKVRVMIVEAFAQIHEALDDRQRRILADFIESRGRGGWGGGGPPWARRTGGDDHERWV
ncbi:MAG TPA: periplasmic heavy metal sensor [Polyangiaceae bacterium]